MAEGSGNPENMDQSIVDDKEADTDTFTLSEILQQQKEIEEVCQHNFISLNF